MKRTVQPALSVRWLKVHTPVLVKTMPQLPLAHLCEGTIHQQRDVMLHLILFAIWQMVLQEGGPSQNCSLDARIQTEALSTVFPAQHQEDALT